MSDLARKSGVSRPTLDKWLSGESTPTLDYLDKIAEALDTTPAALLAEDQGPLPASMLARLARCDEHEIAAIQATLAIFDRAAERSAKTEKKPKSTG